MARKPDEEPLPSPDIPQPDSGSGDNSGTGDIVDPGPIDAPNPEPDPSPDAPPPDVPPPDMPPSGEIPPPEIPPPGEVPPPESAPPGEAPPPESAPPGEAPPPGSPPPGETSPSTPGVPSPPNHDLPGLQGVLDWLQAALQRVQDSVNAITSQIHDTIAALIESLVPPTVAAITGLASIMGELVQGLLNNLASTVEVGQMQQDAITGGVPVALQAFIDAAWEQRGDSIANLTQHVVNNDQVPAEIKAVFQNIHSGTNPVEKLLGIFGLAGLVAAAAGTLLGPILEKARQGSAAAFRPEIPDLATINDLFLRGLIDSGQYNTIAAKLGYEDVWIDQIRDANFREFSVEELQEMRRRGMLDTDQYLAHLRLHGFSQAQGSTFDVIRWMVPTYTDLVHFMTRDAFWDSDNSPFGNIVSDFQLNFGEDNLPFDQFAQAGVPEQMARWAWRAHWEIPGRHDANEMFFRGTLGDRSPGGDGEKVLERVYRARGIEPRFIQPLIATAFHPIGRIDIRRLIKSGQMDRDGAIEAYQQIGYNTDNATQLADLAILLSTQESAAEKEPFRSGLKARIVTAYINGTIGRDEAVSALTDLHYHEEAINLFVNEAEVERQAETAGHIRQGVQRLYVAREWEKDQATQYLDSHGFAGPEIDRLFESWDLLRELSDLKADHKSHKEATRADVISAYTDDIIDRDSAANHLATLGYNDDDIAMFLSLIDHRKAKQDITAEVQGVQAAFLDRQISTDQAIHELDAIGINGNRRDALVRKWSAELDKRQPELPLAMIEKLALAKLYSTDDLIEELRQRHFRQDQIEKFVRLWGYEIEVVAARDKTKAQREVDAENRRKEADQRRVQAEQRRIAAKVIADERRAQADERRHEADARRAANDAARARSESIREHDRLLREAHAGRLSIGRIRTAFTLGIIPETSATQLMEAIGLRPETAQMELDILHEQQRAKNVRSGGQGGGTTIISPVTPTPIT